MEASPLARFGAFKIAEYPWSTERGDECEQETSGDRGLLTLLLVLGRTCYAYKLNSDEISKVDS